MAKVLDCRGLACPKPVILTKKELESIDSGEVTSIVDNDVARDNVKKLAQSKGYSYKIDEKEGLFYITINKSAESCITGINDDNNLVLLISSDKMGSGDETLGKTLMKSYMFALTEADVVPKTMLFLNSGVKLTIEGSEVLESLQVLYKKGVEMMSCGTCLDFYNLKEKLIIGTVTNMYTIVEKMNNASNTIKL